MHVLGLSCHYHDAAAALLRDGTLVAAAEEERFSRVKHDPSFPRRAIDFCLRRAGIGAAELDYVVFYEKPLVKFERILLTALRTYPRSWRSFTESMTAWFDEKLWIKAQIRRELGVPAERVLFTEHHLAHAASAFFCSPWDEAAILTVDGVGEWTTTAVGRGVASWEVGGRNRIQLTRETRFPHSLGLLYSAFTAFLGFEVNEGEHRVMGMAAYGEPRYQDRVRRLIRVAEDGSFELELDYFSFQHSTDRAFGPSFVELFGPPRDPRAEPVLSAPGPAGAAGAGSGDRYYADVAASIQRVMEDTLVAMARHLHRETGLPRLCMAGGVALNGLANGRILRESGFRELFVQPAAGDAGGALGAALYAHHVLLGEPRAYVMEHAFVGEEPEEAAVRALLDRHGVRYQRFGDDAALVERLVDDLASGRVLGWVQGRFEWGPRALGGRSILADPRRPDMQELLNRKVKFREAFRPFAPAVPQERAAELFPALAGGGGDYPSRYMLLVLPWDPEWSGAVPAVSHAGTGRVQVVHERWSPRYHRLIRSFGEATGVPVLLNTSFNLRGEPVVATPADALHTFRRSGLDVLVLGDLVVRR